MSATAATIRFDADRTARNVLDASAKFWWAVTALGQWLFALYIAAYFGPKLALHGIEGLQQTHLFNGFIPGDGLGNAAVAAHVLLAIVIMVGGPLQLIPQIRARFPAFHHWTGRIYVATAVTSSIAGLYLIWTRPLFGPLVNNVGTSLGGVLVIIFAAIALRHAIARDIPTHQRWALRLFMAASAVWFLRVAVYAWGFLTGGAGMDSESFSGPFVTFIHFAQYLLPLAVLEMYLRARDRGTAQARFVAAAGLTAFTLVTGLGVFLLVAGSWLPRI